MTKHFQIGTATIHEYTRAKRVTASVIQLSACCQRLLSRLVINGKRTQIKRTIEMWIVAESNWMVKRHSIP